MSCLADTSQKADNLHQTTRILGGISSIQFWSKFQLFRLRKRKP